LIFNPQITDDDDKNMRIADYDSGSAHKKKGLVAEDTTAQNSGTAVAYDFQGEEELQDPPTEESTFPSPSVNIKELEHGPSDDKNVKYKLEPVVHSLLLNIKDINTDEF